MINKLTIKHFDILFVITVLIIIFIIVPTIGITNLMDLKTSTFVNADIETSNVLENDNTLIVESITMTFENDNAVFNKKPKSKTIYKDKDSGFFKSESHNNFEKYGIYLSDDLEYPRIKAIDREKLTKYINDKFENKTYNDIFSNII